MSKEDKIKQLLAELKAICEEIGCSGLDKQCPGNLKCDILRKLVLG